MDHWFPTPLVLCLCFCVSLCVPSKPLSFVSGRMLKHRSFCTASPSLRVMQSDFTTQFQWVTDEIACLWQHYYFNTQDMWKSESEWCFGGPLAENYPTIQTKCVLADPPYKPEDGRETHSTVTSTCDKNGLTTELHIHLIQEWDQQFDFNQVESRIRKHVFAVSLLFI